MVKKNTTPLRVGYSSVNRIPTQKGRPDLSMSLVHTSNTAQRVKVAPAARYPWWRAAALGALLLLALVLYPFLYRTAPPDTILDNYLYQPFLRLWMVSFLPYFAACALVLATRPSQGRWRWIELGIVLGGALLLRALLLPLPPGFSRDSWRYLWDARVTLHGFSPYIYSPNSAPLQPLIDTVLYPRMRFRASPTIYPPGAQAIFLLSYLLGGSNLYFLKGIFLIFDMITCGALVVFLNRKRIDPLRVLIYAWCPLPIIEFAVQGHLDVITLTFSILALLSFSNKSIGGRMLTGFLVGMAALTKIYPILLLVVIVPDMIRDAAERYTVSGTRAGTGATRAGASPAPTLYGIRDFVRSRVGAGLVPALVPLLAVCFLTILLGYLPYYIMGHGQVLGYFTIYSSEQGENAGFIQLVMQWVSYANRWSLQTTVAREHLVSLLFIVAVSLVVFVARLRRRMSMPMAALLLFGAILAISPHVFPWYTTVLLLWMPLLIGPLWTRRRMIGSATRAGTSPAPTLYGIRDLVRNRVGAGLVPALVVLAVWYFVCVSILQYYYTSGPHHYVPNWTSYYQVAYLPLVIVLAMAAIVGLIHILSIQKGKQYANRR